MLPLLHSHTAGNEHNEQHSSDEVGATFIVDFKGSNPPAVPNITPPRVRVSISPEVDSVPTVRGRKSDRRESTASRDSEEDSDGSSRNGRSSDAGNNMRFKDDKDSIAGGNQYTQFFGSSPTMAQNILRSASQISTLNEGEPDVLPPICTEGSLVRQTDLTLTTPTNSFQRIPELSRPATSANSIIGDKGIYSDSHPQSLPPASVFGSSSPGAPLELSFSLPSDGFINPEAPNMMTSSPPPYTPRTQRVSLLIKHESTDTQASSSALAESSSVANSTKRLPFSRPQILTPPQRQDINDTAVRHHKKTRRRYSNRGRASATPKEKPGDHHTELQDDSKFKIERLLGKRTRRGVQEFYVKWLGYPLSGATWEPENNLRTDLEDGDGDDEAWMSLLDTLPKKRKKA